MNKSNSYCSNQTLATPSQHKYLKLHFINQLYRITNFWYSISLQSSPYVLLIPTDTHSDELFTQKKIKTLKAIFKVWNMFTPKKPINMPKRYRNSSHVSTSRDPYFEHCFHCFIHISIRGFFFVPLYPISLLFSYTYSGKGPF